MVFVCSFSNKEKQSAEHEMNFNFLYGTSQSRYGTILPWCSAIYATQKVKQEKNTIRHFMI